MILVTIFMKLKCLIMQDTLMTLILIDDFATKRLIIKKEVQENTVKENIIKNK